MPAKEPTWTEERLELLKSRFAEGLTCREIADDIGVSRNAVIGKISRLNLSRQEGANEGFSERKETPKARPPRNPSSSQRQILKTLRPKPAAAEAPLEAPLLGEHRCSLLELNEG